MLLSLDSGISALGQFQQKLNVIANLYKNSASLKFGARLLLLADATADLGLKFWFDADCVQVMRKNRHIPLLTLPALDDAESYAQLSSAIDGRLQNE